MDALSETGASLATVRVTVDLGALAANWRSLAALAPGAATAAVVKADAYGIGLEPALRTLAAAGCRTFFVATAEEGITARAHLPKATIYILDGLPQRGAARLSALALRPVLGSAPELAEWAAFRRDGGAGAAALHVDTGMNRLGLSIGDATTLATDKELVRLIAPTLLMSHLACADTPVHPLNATQLGRFRTMRAAFPVVPASLANSAGIQLGTDYQFDLTRPGIMLYGGRGDLTKPALRPVVTVEARVLQVRDVAPGEPVGYGATERVRRRSRLATVGIGYADGYHRRAGASEGRRGAQTFVHGRLAPLVGRVSMDLVVIDVTDIPNVERGDFVELFGRHMPVDAVAERAGTISYELLTQLSRRAERRYVGGPG